MSHNDYEYQSKPSRGQSNDVPQNLSPSQREARQQIAVLQELLDLANESIAKEEKAKADFWNCLSGAVKGTADEAANLSVLFAEVAGGAGKIALPEALAVVSQSLVRLGAQIEDAFTSGTRQVHDLASRDLTQDQRVSAEFALNAYCDAARICCRSAALTVRLLESAQAGGPPKTELAEAATSAARDLRKLVGEYVECAVAKHWAESTPGSLPEGV